jgi:hypothetical protein
MLRPYHLYGLLGQLRRLHPIHRVGLQLAFSHRPLEEGVQAAVAVVSGRRLPMSQLVGDERLDVLALEFASKNRLAVGLAVGREQPYGVGVGLDGSWALVLGLKRAAKAPVED